MLKIKDSIDLKELGFDKDDDDLIWQNSNGLMIVFGKISLPSFNQERCLDDLFGLIQAGFVEKVSDED